MWETPRDKPDHENKKGCEVLGYEEDEILGRNWFDSFIPESIREELRTLFSKMIEGEVGAAVAGDWTARPKSTRIPVSSTPIRGCGVGFGASDAVTPGSGLFSK